MMVFTGSAVVECRSRRTAGMRRWASAALAMLRNCTCETQSLSQSQTARHTRRKKAREKAMHCRLCASGGMKEWCRGAGSGHVLALVDHARAEVLAVGVGKRAVAVGQALKPGDAGTLFIAHVGAIIPKEIPPCRAMRTAPGLAPLALQAHGVATPTFDAIGLLHQGRRNYNGS